MKFDRTPREARPQPTVSATEHETVIKLVLSGPILGAHEAHLAEIPELAALRDRVAALEHALADADARIAGLSRAVAEAIASSPVVEPISESVELMLRRAAEEDRAALTAGDSWTGMAALAPPAGEAAAPAPAPARQPVNGSHPPPQADDGAAPKVRGLRRMAAALKHT